MRYGNILLFYTIERTVPYQATEANTEALETLNTRCRRLLEIVIKPLESKDESEISEELWKIIERLERYCIVILLLFSSDFVASRLHKILSDTQKGQPGKVISVINHADITLALKDVNDKITQLVDFFMASSLVDKCCVYYNYPFSVGDPYLRLAVPREDLGAYETCKETCLGKFYLLYSFMIAHCSYITASKNPKPSQSQCSIQFISGGQSKDTLLPEHSSAAFG